MVIEYITHYYRSVPFRSLTALAKSEALQVMGELCDDTPFSKGLNLRNNTGKIDWKRKDG